MTKLTVRSCGTISALNDMAVSLLERGYPEFAVETLSDALQLMQEQTIPSIKDVQAASTRYAKALCQAPQNCFADLTVQRVDHVDFCALRAVAKGRCQIKMCFPVSISSCGGGGGGGGASNSSNGNDQDELGHNDAAAVQNFGILLYNLGLANLLRAAAAQTTPPSLASKEEEFFYLEASLNGLQMAETTFASLLEQTSRNNSNESATTNSNNNNTNNSNNNKTPHQEQVEVMSLLLSVLVMNTMSMVYTLLEQPWKSEQALHVASILNSNICAEALVRQIMIQHEPSNIAAATNDTTTGT